MENINFEAAYPQILKKLFSHSLREAETIMQPCIDEDLDARVLVGVLKLSEGDLEKLSYYAHYALRDSRDLLMRAEFYLSGNANLSEEEKEVLRSREMAEYIEWLLKNILNAV